MPFSIRDTIGDTIRTLSTKAAEKGLTLTHELVGDVPEGLRGDPGRLRQVLINLVSNALKFTHVGGVAVTVSAQSNTEDACELHFSIADTGIGIPPDQQEAIFDIFAQADGSTTRRYGGTGLGLTISAQLVEMMGGRVWVESEVGVGSTFHFTARLEIVDDTTAVVATTDLSRTTVLAIGGGDGQRSVTEMLRQGGMHPMAAATARDALDLLDHMAPGERPHALIIDAVNEYDVPSRLVDLDIPIVLLANPGRRGDAARYRELGVAGYLTKPVGQADLLDAIRTAVAGTAAGALITRHWLREHRLRYRILLADDSPTNRMLAMRILENRGHAVTAVDDGRQAIEALERSQFDVILMDVQMPVMDGLEATVAIRMKESSEGGHIPIVALTAHALDSDRQRCLDAGMDAHVSKPFRAPELFATIEQLAAPAGKPPSALIDNDDYADGGPAIDRRELMSSVGDIPDLVQELVSLVAEEVPPIADDIPPAIARGDLEVVSRRAHRIKGSVGSIAAQRAHEAASSLESAARAGDSAATAAAWDLLSRELKFLQAEIDSLLEDRVV